MPEHGKLFLKRTGANQNLKCWSKEVLYDEGNRRIRRKPRVCCESTVITTARSINVRQRTLKSEVTWHRGIPPLTFLQLVLHNHQEGNADHEEVEAEADLAELPYGSPAHLTHHILVRLLPADWWGITENNQTADEENQRNLKKNETDVTLLKRNVIK